ncbi:MAG: hypothetical protein V8T01_00965 [Oscillospiraceae bacterium]
MRGPAWRAAPAGVSVSGDVVSPVVGLCVDGSDVISAEVSGAGVVSGSVFPFSAASTSPSDSPPCSAPVLPSRTSILSSSLAPE